MVFFKMAKWHVITGVSHLAHAMGGGGDRREAVEDSVFLFLVQEQKKLYSNIFLLYTVYDDKLL